VGPPLAVKVVWNAAAGARWPRPASQVAIVKKDEFVTSLFEVINTVGGRIGNLNVLPRVLNMLDRIRKIAVSADEHSHVVEVFCGKRDHVDGKLDIDSFLDYRATLRPACKIPQFHFEKIKSLESRKKLLLTLVLIGNFLTVDGSVVVVNSNKLALWPHNLPNEIGEIDIRTTTSAFQGKVGVAPITRLGVVIGKERVARG